MENSGRERRKLLKALAWAGGCGLLLWRFLTPPAAARQKVLVRLRKEELPAKGALVYREARVAVLQDDGKTYALSLVCTHLGCTVKVTPKGLVCPCHGSVFDRHGRVLEGPALKDLPRLAVEEEGEDLVVLS